MLTKDLGGGVVCQLVIPMFVDVCRQAMTEVAGWINNHLSLEDQLLWRRKIPSYMPDYMYVEPLPTLFLLLLSPPLLSLSLSLSLSFLSFLPPPPECFWGLQQLQDSHEMGETDQLLWCR